MFESIWSDVKHAFRFGNMITRLIFINVGAFVLINVIRIFLFLFNGGLVPDFFNDLVHFFCISSDWKFNLTHPWVLFTSMFFHTDIWHILWNMLFLYWFGRILGDLLGDRHVFPIYLLGGITGGLVYFISANLLPFGHLFGEYALGASAAVMAIVAATGVAFPDYTMHLIFLGPVRLKYIVAVLIFLDLIGIATYSNTGGHFAHLGGAFLGWLYVTQIRQHGRDLSLPVNRTLDQIQQFFRDLFHPPKGPKVVYRSKTKEYKKGDRGAGKSNPNDLSHQEQLDVILDKIKDKGYESLTSEEKEFLFNASKK